MERNKLLPGNEKTSVCCPVLPQVEQKMFVRSRLSLWGTKKHPFAARFCLRWSKKCLFGAYFRSGERKNVCLLHGFASGGAKNVCSEPAFALGNEKTSVCCPVLPQVEQKMFVRSLLSLWGTKKHPFVARFCPGIPLMPAVRRTVFPVWRGLFLPGTDLMPLATSTSAGWKVLQAARTFSGVMPPPASQRHVLRAVLPVQAEFPTKTPAVFHVHAHFLPKRGDFCMNGTVPRPNH